VPARQAIFDYLQTHPFEPTLIQQSKF
jgi:hypothetical protein